MDSMQQKGECLRMERMIKARAALGQISYSAQQDRLELEQSRTRLIELESRCRHYESTLDSKDTDVRALQEECMHASDKIRQLQTQIDWLQKSANMPGTSVEALHRASGICHVSLCSKRSSLQDQRIAQLEKDKGLLEEEVRILREQIANGPRNFTDKTVSSAEYQDARLKIEKLEMQLLDKSSECQQAQVIPAKEARQESAYI